MYVGDLASGGPIPPQVAIGGQAVNIEFFGGAPGYPGYSQVNFRMPEADGLGPVASVRRMYLGRSNNAVTIATH
jgi:uncharacterized protein (TIGR03437 family)